MVASDITTGDIKRIWKKFVNCHEKTCYDQIYENPDLTEGLKPTMHIKENKLSQREELQNKEFEIEWAIKEVQGFEATFFVGIELSRKSL